MLSSKKKSSLEYAKLMCESIMNRYSPEELPPNGTLFYHQGVFLSGMQQLYLLSGEKKYFQYIKDYVDCCIGNNGEVYGIDHESTNWHDTDAWAEGLKLQSLTMLDCKQPVILLYNLYDETGDEKYERAISTISESMYYWPVNKIGGYWHMMDHPNQMWMDGLYMAGPLSVMYSEKFGDERLRERAIRQALIMNKNMRKENGLYYHGWDLSKQAEWADKETGLSKECWGRAVGWYAVAILDMLDYIPEKHPEVERLKAIETDLLKSLAKYQDPKTGMWFNVLDKPEREDNWIETSCSALFTYSYAKALRMGIIEIEYDDILEKAYDGIINSLSYDEKGYLVLDNVCQGCCIEDGTYEHYVKQRIIKNDLHGSGAFVLMCTEMERYRLWKENNKYL